MILTLIYCKLILSLIFYIFGVVQKQGKKERKNKYLLTDVEGGNIVLIFTAWKKK